MKEFILVMSLSAAPSFGRSATIQPIASSLFLMKLSSFTVSLIDSGESSPSMATFPLPAPTTEKGTLVVPPKSKPSMGLGSAPKNNLFQKASTSSLIRSLSPVNSANMPGSENQRSLLYPPTENIVSPERIFCIFFSLSPMLLPSSPMVLRGKGQSEGEPFRSGRFIPADRRNGSGMMQFVVSHFFDSSALRKIGEILLSSPWIFHMASPILPVFLSGSCERQAAFRIRGGCISSSVNRSPPSLISMWAGHDFFSLPQ